ncbi:chromo' (CHRromatin Organization MOdifier) domain protein [Ancylostoma ceylanicum]|uniref:Chromo' (CHRromatin Organization MOdifier) domain protein n=1 Tax=Ancylostoma ceylanicum TaxID=53326 RepID=A0A0D6LRP6_9BILA|nr:chromo' (CHRromatin Organization MOdifier) domain protein [Ancylostoma ceylanicum]
MIFRECEAYTVEKILKTRKRGGRREYLIKWEGWPLDQSTWEAESDCDCEEAIKQFYETSGSQKGGKGKRKSEINGNVQSSSQEFRTARRATLDEIKGVMPEKRRRTISKEQSVPKSKRAASPASAKQQCEAYVKPEEEPTSKEEKLLTPIKDERKPPSPAKSPVKEERLRSPLAEKPDDDRVYKLQQGHEVERIVGLNREGSRLLYVVLYKGTSPKHQRMEYVPSKILRSHAMELWQYRLVFLI